MGLKEKVQLAVASLLLVVLSFVIILYSGTRSIVDDVRISGRGEWRSRENSIRESHYYCSNDGRYIGEVWQHDGDFQSRTFLKYEEYRDIETGNLDERFATEEQSKRAVETRVLNSAACR